MDNSYISLATIDDFKSMYNSMTIQGTNNFNYSQSLKLALSNANTEEEINAIKW